MDQEASLAQPVHNEAINAEAGQEPAHHQASANNTSNILNTSTDILDQSQHSYTQNLSARLNEPISIQENSDKAKRKEKALKTTNPTFR